MRRTFIALLVSALASVGLGVAMMPNAGATLTGHCKDAAHIQVVVPGSAPFLGTSDVSVHKVTAVAGDCVNDLAYAGDIYQITTATKNINLKPDAGTELCGLFGYAYTYNSTSELQHTNGGPMSYVVFGDFSVAAEGAVAYVLHLAGLC